MRAAASIVVLLIAIGAIAPAEARTVYRCVGAGTVSLATAPEPGSREPEATATGGGALRIPATSHEICRRRIGATLV